MCQCCSQCISFFVQSVSYPERFATPLQGNSLGMRQVTPSCDVLCSTHYNPRLRKYVQPYEMSPVPNLEPLKLPTCTCDSSDLGPTQVQMAMKTALEGSITGVQFCPLSFQTLAHMCKQNLCQQVALAARCFLCCLVWDTSSIPSHTSLNPELILSVLTPLVTNTIQCQVYTHTHTHIHMHTRTHTHCVPWL